MCRHDVHTLKVVSVTALREKISPMQVLQGKVPLQLGAKEDHRVAWHKNLTQRLLEKDTGGWLPVFGVRSSGELSGKQAYLTFLGVEISRVGIGGISSPELGQA